MQVKRVKLSELTLDPDNANEHSEDSIQAIMRSLKRFGQQKPVVIDSDRVVRAGNGLVVAAMRLCWREVDVIETSLKGPMLEAYGIADNKTAKYSNLDDRRIARKLKELEEENSRLIQSAGEMSDEDREALELAAAFDVQELLNATGFTESDRRKLSAAANVFSGSSGSESESSPKAVDTDEVKYSVIVPCSSRESQNETYNALIEAGYKARKAST